jgi:hypothetical protein
MRSAGSKQNSTIPIHKHPLHLLVMLETGNLHHKYSNKKESDN